MAQEYYPTFAEVGENLEYHLRKIRESVVGYRGENPEERDIHLKAVAVCLSQYMRDLEANDAADGGRREFVKMLNEALTELMGYFRFKFREDDPGHCINESTAVVLAYFLDKGTRKLRDLAQGR